MYVRTYRCRRGLKQMQLSGLHFRETNQKRKGITRSTRGTGTMRLVPVPLVLLVAPSLDERGV